MNIKVENGSLAVLDKRLATFITTQLIDLQIQFRVRMCGIYLYISLLDSKDHTTFHWVHLLAKAWENGRLTEQYDTKS